MFRIALVAFDIDYMDPALAYSSLSWALLDPTCARLMNYSDKPLPAGSRLIPEVAVRSPSVSPDRRIYTFTLRDGFRFSDGTPVRASAFARAIHRTLTPGIKSPGAQYTDSIVGAKDFQTGRTRAIAGVVANGNRLVIRFTRPVPDFTAQTTMPFFCAVPPTLPADPEGVSALPGAGPYYVAEYRVGQRAVLRPNRFYGGKRPHHVDGFLIDLTAESPHQVIDRIESGEVDWGWTPPPFAFDPAQRLVAKYGVNRSQFFANPGPIFKGYVLNSSRPLFRDNARLRRAVNFAVDRLALQRLGGGPYTSRLTDQYLPSAMPGFKDAHIYSLRRPDLKRARTLAHGQTRGKKAVLYTFDDAPPLAWAQILRQNLAKIGLDVQVKGIPIASYFGRLNAPGEPFDIAFFNWQPDYLDPYAYINLFFDSRFIGGTNYGRFSSDRYDRLIRNAALLQGSSRYRVYGKLDIQLARDAAPMVATEHANEPTLVSKRVGCIVLRPSLDLSAVCLKK
jgi:peptide/nickel transport system substrate-binding protein